MIDLLWNGYGTVRLILMFSYIFLRFHRFQFLGANSKDFMYRRKLYITVRNRRKRKKPYEICPNWNGFLQFCMMVFVRFPTVSYDFLRLFFSIRAIMKIFIFDPILMGQGLLSSSCDLR